MPRGDLEEEGVLHMLWLLEAYGTMAGADRNISFPSFFPVGASEDCRFWVVSSIKKQETHHVWNSGLFGARNGGEQSP